MLTCSFITLTIFLDIFIEGSVIEPDSPTNSLTVTDNILFTMLKDCDLGLKNLIFYTGDNPGLTSVLLSTSPRQFHLESWILISNTNYIEFRNLTAIDGYVIVFNSRDEWNSLWTNIIVDWQCSKNCTVIFLSKVNPHSCAFVKTTIKMMGYWYFDTVYYICVDRRQGPIVFTRNQFQDSRPPKWNTIDWDVDSLYPGSFYSRKYDADLCLDFNFIRERPTENIQVLVGFINMVEEEELLQEDAIYRGDISRVFAAPILKLLERLLRIKFLAYVTTLLRKKDENLADPDEFLFMTKPIDILPIRENLIGRIYTSYLHPTTYDTFVILSHRRPEATPLEKIAKFYGLYTLLSLLLILAITFFVVYYKKNRNPAYAAFDVLRLLIDTGVGVPINTLPLKVFFCSIFMYFLVIHSTFSGNLQKFLTIPEYYDAVDSLEDLIDPRITAIYDAGFHEQYEEKNNPVINKKLKTLLDHDHLFDHFTRNPNSVCISDGEAAFAFIAIKELVNEVHVSKSRFGICIAARVARRRFYLQEKFQWATTYLFDIAVKLESGLSMAEIKQILEKQKILSHISFRIISIDDLKFVFFLLIIGYLLGFICFLIELVIGRMKLKKLSKNTNKNIRRIDVKPSSSISAQV